MTTQLATPERGTRTREALPPEDTTNVNRAALAALGTAEAYAEHARAKGAPGQSPFGATEQNWRRREKFFRYNAEFSVDVTRARCLTEVFRETEGEPQSLRMARGIARTLAEMPLFVDEDDLFAGNLTGKPSASHLYPELMPDYYLCDWEALRGGRSEAHVTAEEIAILEDIAPYWRGNTIADRWNQLRQEADNTLNQHGLYFSYNMLAGIGHLIVNVPLVLQRGLAGLREDAIGALHDHRMTAREPDPERIAFYESVLISLDGVSHYADRYADECSRMAREARTPERRAQLERMAEACRRVPERPARTSFEALQCALLLCFAVATESCQISICPGRVDQWLAPYADRELAAGTPPETLIEYLEAFLIKLAHFRLFTGPENEAIGGGSELCTVTIGGSHPDGSDATTSVTELVLRAHNHIRMACPPLALRIHPGTPDRVWAAAAKCVSNGCGMPSFMNDAIMVPALMDLGYSTEDAHNYADIGCVEMGSAGTSLGPVSIGFINLAKVLELALNDGQCMLWNTQLGPHSGTLATHESFAAVLEAYKTQLAFAVENFNQSVSALEQAHSEMRPVPLLSAFTDNALAEGRDLIHGSSKYRAAGLEGIGYAEVADSLTAIAQFVYDRKELSGSELLEQLRTNFADGERLRLTLLNRAPKYGNDNDAADAMLATVARVFVEEIKQHRDYWNDEYYAGAWSIALAMHLGMPVAALPNGRRACETLTEGIRPASGCDRDGPTSCIRSVAKMDHRQYQNGSIFNMTFAPSALEGEANQRKFVDLVRTFFDLGGFQLQVNVADAEVLREAQAHPERYRDLIVRVAGYCAYFVEQTPRVQDQIIARTVHGTD